MDHIGGNSMSRLGPTGLTQLLTNIKTWVTTKLGNYVTTDTAQTVTGKKLFTASSIQLDNVTSMSGSTMLINTSAAAPRGEFPAEAHRVGRIYIGDNTSYNGAWFIVDPTIDTNKAYYRMVTTNPDNTDSARFSITWDGSKTGARCRKNVSQGDLLPSGNNTYNLGADELKWDIGYIHNLIGTNKENASEDANDYYSTTSGSHMTFYTTSNGGTKLSNVPAAVNTHLESRTIRYLSSSDWIVEQICHNSFGLYYRKGTNGTWEDWKTFAFTNSNITGTAANVTGTVAIANGGTGATTRLNAVKNLTNESVGTPTHFLAITTNWGKAGYTTVAQAKTVLGITGDIVSHNASEFLTTSGNETVTGTKIFNGDKIVITQGNGYRMVCNTDGGSSGYGVFQRVDSANWYLMVTAQDDALGTWTTARPASMNLSTGVLSINGNAGTATQFSANKDVTLTGDVTGTASSKAGWSVTTTLADSGVTAGTYGPSADVTGSNNATILVPEITVDAKGRVTAVNNRTYTSVNTDSDKKVYQYYKSDDNVYRLLFSNNAGNTATSNVGAVYSGLNNSFYVNPSTGALYATKLYSNGVEVLTSHQSLSNYVTLNTAQEITNTKTFKDATTVRKLTSVEAGNVIPSSDKLISDIWQDKNGKELGRIYYVKSSGGNTALVMRAGDWFSESEGVYSLNASGTNRRAELHLYSDSSGNCCIKPVGYFSATLKALSTSVWLGESTKPFGRVYANTFEFCNAGLLPDTDVQTNEEHSIGFYGQNNIPLSYITFQKRTGLTDRIAIRIQTAASAYKSYCFDANCLYPEVDNSLDIGSSSKIFKNIYCNNYYKGTTAFGDIVTHNASEFLTQHPSITLSTNTTSTESPSHGGTFTCIDSVTQDANGHITLVNTKTITLPADSNTDTKVTQTVTTGNSAYPVLLCATANATATGTTTSRFSAGLTVNTRYSSIYMTNKYDTANTKGVRNTSSYSNGILYFRSYDDTQMGTIRCESNKGGYQQIYMMASNYIKDGAIDPEGTSTTCYITVRVRDNGSKTIYTDGSWENSLTPYANNTYSLGTSSNKWKEAHAVNFYENGTALSSKYVQINSLAGGNTAGSLTHSIGSLVLARCSMTAFNPNIKLYGNVAGLQLYPCRTEIYTIYDASGTRFVPIVVKSSNDSNLGSGTWRYLGGASTDFSGDIYGMFLRVA